MTPHDLKPFVLAALLPPTPFLLLALLGLGLQGRKRRLGKGFLLAGLLGVWMSCTDATGQLLASHLLRVPPGLSKEQLLDLKRSSLQNHDVAVLVLGAGARRMAPEYLGPRLKTLSLERLQYGVWLSRQLQAPLGFSGGIGWNSKQRGVSEGELAQDAVQNEYLSRLRWVESKSRDTAENAKLSLPLLKAEGIHKVLLVTHDMHMPRALRAFQAESQGELEIIAAPLGLAAEGGQTDWEDWFPSWEGMQRVQYAVYEGLGLLAGR
ncbi:YdcF family protein [Paucibacter sp. KBW04]|uniref:YdcF family protein n=1 Tax=Paucibacter sp. KBW04 TaxID=2153361 RepID=UPI000F580D4A|nr:YdcF family protein [Paucibacter sp. KBW04]RQO55284.1 YdcF family protein [Paucibacter sp. KBW04]